MTRTRKTININGRIFDMERVTDEMGFMIKFKPIAKVEEAKEDE